MKDKNSNPKTSLTLPKNPDSPEKSLITINFTLDLRVIFLEPISIPPTL